MNRRSRYLVVLMVAVVTATIASFTVYRAVLQRPVQAADARQFLVVAARPMPIGTELTELDVKVLSWPAGNPISGAVADVKTVVNRGLLTAVLENEPITMNKLASVGRRPDACHSARHAGDVRQGQRRHRRGRIRRPRHASRRGRDDSPHA